MHSDKSDVVDEIQVLVYPAEARGPEFKMSGSPRVRIPSPISI